MLRAPNRRAANAWPSSWMTMNTTYAISHTIAVSAEPRLKAISSTMKNPGFTVIGKPKRVTPANL